MELDWTGIAALTGLAAIVVQIGHLTIGAYRRHSRQLSLLARRHNEGMSFVEVIYGTDGQIIDGQLNVTGLWPRSLFLLPGGGGPLKKLPDGQETIDGNWRGSRRAVTCRMGKDAHGRLFGSVHVWSKRPFRSAVLMVTVRDRASAKVLISRTRIINPMA